MSSAASLVSSSVSGGSGDGFGRGLGFVQKFQLKGHLFRGEELGIHHVITGSVAGNRLKTVTDHGGLIIPQGHEGPDHVKFRTGVDARSAGHTNGAQKTDVRTARDNGNIQVKHLVILFFE